MAGSIKWMIYESDQGEQYATKVDESNGILAGFDDYTGTGDSVPVMPKGFKMRKVNLKSSDGLTSRSLPCGKATAGLYTGTETSVSLNGITYVITSTTGEKAVKPYALDTGLNDGTPG